MEEKRLTEATCQAYFEEYQTPKHIIAHCKAVSRVAVRIGEELNKNGFHLDLELIRLSGLIHDMARMHEPHDQVAADRLEKDGYRAEANIVRQHMTYRFGNLDTLTETDMVCLADRTVRENEFVGLEKRINYLIHKGTPTPERTEILLQAKKKSEEYIALIEERIGKSLESLFTTSLDHLLKQVEKPARYTGGEINMVVKNPEDVDCRFGFAFPDMYEIGMSYVGLQILYNITNQREGIYCERVFAPAPDMEDLMREHDVPLFTLETKSPVMDMDVFGFTLQYEMSFTNLINMMDLAKLPLLAKDRDERYPLVIAGGPCAFNPEPLADFVDVFLIGDGEELLPELLERYGKAKKEGVSRLDFLKEISSLQGVYVPSFYAPVYGEDGCILEYKKTWDGAPDRVEKAMIHDLNQALFPENNLVPLIETVHDRSVVETFRGCTRGCRFCQAGMIYRPIRERSREEIMRIAQAQLENTGHDELSILSLSTSDYSEFEGLATDLMQYCQARDVSLSLPSLRLDSFSFKVLEEIQKYKKSGLTFAPEAGTQRLRDIINKGITEEDIFSAVEQAIELGWRNVKLYFMIGLPGETEEDLDGIADIARKVVGIHSRSGKGGRFNVTVSISNFVPKAHTPFQWFGQDSTSTFTEKHNYLTERLKMKKVTYNYHDDAVSTCEAIFARGDRRLSELLLLAHEKGCRFDGWSEHFHWETWREILEEFSVDYHFYTERPREYDEVLPWDIIDSGVTKEFLRRENEKAMNAVVTDDCRKGCVGCGIQRFTKCEKGGSLV